jgi:rod shape-determining protein MreC
MAMVVSLTHDGAIARPLSDPAASEIVAVQPSWEPTADPTLPPAPDVPPPPPKKPRAPKSPSPAKNRRQAPMNAQRLIRRAARPAATTPSPLVAYLTPGWRWCWRPGCLCGR